MINILVLVIAVWFGRKIIFSIIKGIIKICLAMVVEIIKALSNFARFIISIILKFIIIYFLMINVYYGAYKFGLIKEISINRNIMELLAIFVLILIFVIKYWGKDLVSASVKQIHILSHRISSKIYFLKLKVVRVMKAAIIYIWSTLKFIVLTYIVLRIVFIGIASKYEIVNLYIPATSKRKILLLASIIIVVAIQILRKIISSVYNKKTYSETYSYGGYYPPTYIVNKNTGTIYEDYDSRANNISENNRKEITSTQKDELLSRGTKYHMIGESKSD